METLSAFVDRSGAFFIYRLDACCKLCHVIDRMSRIEQLKRKLEARTGVPGYERNCEAIRAEIERLASEKEKR